MRREFAGLHAGEELRVEKFPEGWKAQARMREVGAALGPAEITGLYEFRSDGHWTPIGTFRTLHLAEVALRLLKEGSHLVRSDHDESVGDAMVHVPARLVKWEEARSVLVSFGLAESDDVPGPSSR